MTNAEKYQEVFGFKPDTGNCPTEDCNQCPCKLIDNKGNLACVGISVSDWWDSEYKEVNTMKEIIRFINADDFISMVEDGTFIYLQHDKEDVIEAVRSMPVYEISADNVRLLMTKYINGEQI